MRRFNALVFDDIVSGVGGVVYTPSQYDAALGQFDSLSMHVILDDVVGASPGGLDVYMSHSGDARVWWTKNGGAPVFSVSALSGQTTSDTYTESAAELSMAFVRLAFRLSVSTSVRARVFVTARDGAG